MHLVIDAVTTMWMLVHVVENINLDYVAIRVPVRGYDPHGMFNVIFDGKEKLKKKTVKSSDAYSTLVCALFECDEL